ncbi:MAG: GWxTD domain-containing protein [Candidatus Kapabacteria bacterium]|nr:GWxTD domain-containing protein [Candidatus Kapabacteria bacterium]
MKVLAIIVSLVFLGLGLLHAQDLSDITVDEIQFRNINGSVKWEFHYSFPDTCLRYIKAPSGFVGEMYCRVELSTDTGIVYSDEWIAAAASITPTPSHRQFYSGIRSLVVSPGMYSVLFVTLDVNDTMKTTRRVFKTVVPVSGMRPALSDVMFVMPSAASTKFQRNGVAAEPNPRHEVIGSDPLLCLYFEVYNAKSAGLGDFYIGVSVLNNVMEEQFTTFIPMSSQSDGLIVREELAMLGIPTGVYTLRVQILSKDRQTVLDTREERFFLLNPDAPAVSGRMLSEDEQFQVSEWPVTTGSKLELELELSDLLASKTEIDVRNGCSDERAKQRYLFRFWKIRDPDQTTQANERLDRFRSDFKRAQTFYRSPTYKDGWRSDRGVTLLKYGPPTQIQRVDHATDAKPHEIWFYQDIQGGVYFYFVDMMLQQNYKLVHSTMIGQVREPNWFNLYARAFNPNPNPVNQQPGISR